VTETRADLDGTEIRAAAARAVRLWPDEPDTDAGDTWPASTRTILSAGSAEKDAGA
jgi:hypothetical protein